MEDNHLLSFFNHNNIIDYYICTLIGYNPTNFFFKLKFKTFFIALLLHTTPQAAKLKSLLCLSKCHYYYYYEKKINDLAPVVQTVDNAIHRINHYPLDIAIGFAITYPVDSAIHRLNNWGLVIVYFFCYITFKCTYQNYL